MVGFQVFTVNQFFFKTLVRTSLKFFCRFSSLATIDANGDVTTWDMKFQTHFGLVADRDSKTLLAINSDDNGTIAFMKFN